MNGSFRLSMIKQLLFVSLLITNSAFAQLPPPAIDMPEPAQQGKIQPLLFGFWDDVPDSVLEYVNTGEVHVDDSEREWMKRLRNKGHELQDIDPARIPFGILTHEPYADGFNREKLDIFTAFWYSNKVPDNELKGLMTAGHHAGPNYDSLKQILDYGHKIIPTIGGFKPTETESQLRQRIGWYKKIFERIGWENIEYIILRDEPYPKGFTKEQLEWIIDEALKQYETKVTFSFTRGAILRQDLPENIKTVAINFYPFFRDDAPEGYVQVFDYESFKDHVNLILGTAREKLPGAEFILTVQVFGSHEGDTPPWRMPDPESAEWYMKAVSENPDIIGLTFWAWDTEGWNGLETNPALQKAWVKALKKYTRNL